MMTLAVIILVIATYSWIQKFRLIGLLIYLSWWLGDYFLCWLVLNLWLVLLNLGIHRTSYFFLVTINNFRYILLVNNWSLI